MKPLAQPTPELRARLTREVDFKDRLMAAELHQRAGIATVEVYSLDELFALLNSPHPMIDMAEMAGWCSTVLNDGELAGRIAAAAARDTNQHNRIMHVRDLVGQRLLQCRRAA